MEWKGDCLSLLNQTKLPTEVEYIKCKDYEKVAEAIKKLEVRGAPAIGAAAAYGVVLGAKQFANSSMEEFLKQMSCVDRELRRTRPTAVNLFWSLDRMQIKLRALAKTESVQNVIGELEKEAVQIANDDKKINFTMSEYGAELFDKPVSVLTHCNAGALATVARGTALGVIRSIFQRGNLVRVYADETRPLLQGARLTAFELATDNIPITLITDSMAGWVMKQHKVDAVIVGADRIAANGDTANKIGTYSAAVLAKRHNIPFYVVAPSSTFDFSLQSGEEIPIEERNHSEVTHFFGVRTAPKNIDVYNPAFDVTPAELITGIITEYGVLRADYTDAIKILQEKVKGER
jgi:methylthioribose-1-phosphate isomerase